MNINPKVAAGGVAGSITIILVWVLGFFHVEVPPEVASAFTTIISFGAGWATPSQ